MLRVAEIKLPLDHTDKDLEKAVCRALRIKAGDLAGCTVRRRSVDARKGPPRFTYTVDVRVKDEGKVARNMRGLRGVSLAAEKSYRFPVQAPGAGGSRPVVVGAGPCGLFAGLALARAGFRPLLIERGKPAQDRAGDVARFWSSGVLDKGSNVLFGEGGAGTFSDGKLVTQIRDKEGRCRKVLEELAAAGAPEEILFLAKPHIGTDRLIEVVGNLRRTIEKLGGEVLFESRVSDLVAEGGAVRGVRLDGGRRVETDAVVLAVGHSARDTFAMLAQRGVQLDPKPFSIGLRIEHPQKLIDQALYGAYAGRPELGAAEYKLAHHCKDGRSAYTFCMCPGGKVIGAASEEGRLAVNGMSAYARDGANANSALLVGIRPSDFGGEGPLAGVEFQRRWEAAAFELGGGGFKAPVQLSADFLAGQASSALGSVEPTYRPGVTPCDLSACLPDYVSRTLREAIPAFDRKLRGFALPDAVLTGVESRSSSPVRVTRDETRQSVNLKGLFPAGEGAGYAGGIVSAAVDGLKAAEAVARRPVS